MGFKVNEYLNRVSTCVLTQANVTYGGERVQFFRPNAKGAPPVETQIDLTFKEYELLKYLAVKPGRVFSRESLLHSVWEYDYYGGTRTVDVHIRRLRSKINNIKYNFIETVWNVGYRFKINNEAQV